MPGSQSASGGFQRKAVSRRRTFMVGGRGEWGTQPAAKRRDGKQPSVGMWYHNQTAPTDVSFQYHRIPEMNFLRNHWYDMGAPFIAIILAWLGAAHAALTNYEVLMWLS